MKVVVVPVVILCRRRMMTVPVAAAVRGPADVPGTAWDEYVAGNRRRTRLMLTTPETNLVIHTGAMLYEQAEARSPNAADGHPLRLAR